MKPFLLLQSRPEADAAQNEYEAMCQYGQLKPHQLQRLALNHNELNDNLNLNDYSGLIIGGGPANITDPPEIKATRTYQPVLYRLLKRIIAADFPLLGACLGVGLITDVLGGQISTEYGEPVGPVAVTLTASAASDPLLAGLPKQFDAFVGHHEGCAVPPKQAVVLAGSAACPVQMFRVGQNVYATQFHPELDPHGLALRIQIYKHHGYFQPDEVDRLTTMAHSANVVYPEHILRRFIERYRQPTQQPTRTTTTVVH